MWLAVLALAGVVAAETQCDCTDAQFYNAETRACVDDVNGLPTNWTGSGFLFDQSEYMNCNSKPQWVDHFSNGYSPVYDDDQCSCVASNVINLQTDPYTALGYSWDFSTGRCVSGNLKYSGLTPKSNEIDIKQCAYKLVNGYPNAFSNCGGLNMCHCLISYRFTVDAVALSPDHNATDNAFNVNGEAYTQCGWDFTQNSCVPQATKFSGSPLSLKTKSRSANEICEELGYYVDQSRVDSAPTERYVPPPYVSPTIAICAAKSSDKCTCNEDNRCYMSAELECVPNMVDGLEVNRTNSNVTSELIAGMCGDTYCNTLTTACDCYETPHSTGVCGWDGANSVCDSTTTTDILDIYVAHCCDAFKTPCQCKIGRLPWSGYADFNNTCGWDNANNVCRLSAITTNSEMIGNGCAAADATSNSCLLVDVEEDCDISICSWLDGRHSCVPITA